MPAPTSSTKESATWTATSPLRRDQRASRPEIDRALPFSTDAGATCALLCAGASANRSPVAMVTTRLKSRIRSSEVRFSVLGVVAVDAHFGSTLVQQKATAI